MTMQRVLKVVTRIVVLFVPGQMLDLVKPQESRRT